MFRHPSPLSWNTTLRKATVVVLAEWTVTKASLPERASITRSAETSPAPPTVMAGAASTREVPERSITEPADAPDTRPPQRAPEPVDESVAAPASKTPFTVMDTPSAVRNETPS